MAKNFNSDKKDAYRLLLWNFTSRKKHRSQKTSLTALHQGLINCDPNIEDISPWELSHWNLKPQMFFLNYA